MLKHDLALRENLFLQENKKIIFTVTPPAEKYTLGWKTGVFKSFEFTGHVGGCHGFSADFIRFQQDRGMVIVLSNYTEGVGILATKLHYRVFGADEKNILSETKNIWIA